MDDKSKTCNSTPDTREVTEAVRADLIASTVDVVIGRAIVVTDEDGIIEVDDPRWQVVTWRGNHAAESAEKYNIIST